MPISKYIVVMPFSGHGTGAVRHMLAPSCAAATPAITAQTGEAARESQWAMYGVVAMFHFPQDDPYLDTTAGHEPGESNKGDGISMDRVISTASRALAQGDALGALKRVALRDDPSALALRGIAMAQLGDLGRARELLRMASRAFGPKNPEAVARCDLAAAEIALASRNLGGVPDLLARSQAVLERLGDRRNAAHAAYLRARMALLLGRLDEADTVLAALDISALSPVSRAGFWLVAAGLGMRRIDTKSSHKALDEAINAAQNLGIPALTAEVGRARQALDAPAARLIAEGSCQPLSLAGVEALIASDRLIVDACRDLVRQGNRIVTLRGRPILFGLARVLAEAWPRDVSRSDLLNRVFLARQVDESHRARLRVEIGRLRKAIAPFATVTATPDGYALNPIHGSPAVLAAPAESENTELLALLSDGEAWSSSALALALSVSPRTVQRGLDALRQSGKVEWFNHGPARRWVLATVPGFPTSLLLPAISPADVGQ
jgi:hypothetical protein